MTVRNLLLIFIGTVLTSAFVWVRLQVVNISYDIHSLETKEITLRDEINSLTLKVNEVKAPQRLERLAELKFNMKAPRTDQIIILKK